MTTKEEYIWALEHKDSGELYNEQGRIFTYNTRKATRKAAQGKRFKGLYKPTKVVIVNQTVKLNEIDEYFNGLYEKELIETPNYEIEEPKPMATACKSKLRSNLNVGFKAYKTAPKKPFAAK